MERRYYHVVQEGERWQVRIKTSDEPLYEADTDSAAMDYAIQAARLVWEDFGLPSGVCVRGIDGQWVEERTYGEVQSA